MSDDAALVEEYRRVLAIVRSDRYRGASAWEQREVLWEAVSRTPFDVLPPMKAPLLENVRQILTRRIMNAAFHSEEDVRPPRKKAFHPFGTVAKVRFEAVPGHPYTGLFASGAIGLGRLSLARAEDTFSPSAAFKFFVDGRPTQQLVLDQSLDEQTSRDFFERAPTNITLWPQRGYLKYVWFIPHRWLSQFADPMHQYLDHLAAVTREGVTVPVADRCVPYRVSLYAAPQVHTPPDTKTDFRVAVGKIAPGSILYEVFGTSAPGDEDHVHVGTLTTETPFVASAFGDQVLSLRHSPQRAPLAAPAVTPVAAIRS